MQESPRPLVVDALGVNVEIVFEPDLREGLEQEIRRAWQGALAHSSRADASIRVHDGDVDRVLQSLSSRVTLAALNEQSGKLLMFHAGGIADSDGRVVAFVAPSGTGKTTLTRALAQKYGYVSDETIAVDDDLQVLPYRKPLSIVREGLPKIQVSPSEAGLRPLPDAPLSLVKLVLLDRQPDGPTKLSDVALPEALPLLSKEMSYLREVPTPLQKLADLTNITGGILRLTYSNWKDALPAVPELLKHRSEPESWYPSTGPTPSRESAPYLAVANVLDAISFPDAVTVFSSDGMIRTLHALGPGIWQAALEGMSIDEAVTYLIDRYGRPEGVEPHDQLMTALDGLIEAGIMTHS